MTAIQAPKHRRLALFRRIAGALAVMAGLFAASSAQALVVLVTSTEAFVGEPVSRATDQGPSSASTHGTLTLPDGSSMTGDAVADVFSGPGGD